MDQSPQQAASLPWQTTGVTTEPVDAQPIALKRAEPAPPLLTPGVRLKPKALLDHAVELAAYWAQTSTVIEERKRDVRERFEAARSGLVRQQLADTPVSRLREITEGRLSLAPLEAAGIRNCAQLLTHSPLSLANMVLGVGPQTAEKAIAAVRQLSSALEDRVRVRFDVTQKTVPHTALLMALSTAERAERLIPTVAPAAAELVAQIDDLHDTAGIARSRLRMLFASPGRRRTAKAAVESLVRLLDDESVRQRAHQIDTVLRQIAQPADNIWRDYEKRAADYYGILGEIADLSLDVASVHGFIPAEIANRVNGLQLDTAHLRNVSLRGYQAFGAKFALVQRHAIVGDEMGLGKTIEAIAAMAHLAALGEQHFVVVCPAGVLVNWLREVAKRSALRAYRIHGPEMRQDTARWVKNGGVAVTTYEMLKKWQPEEIKVALLVVDEAHYIKNPAAARSKATVATVNCSERVLFLSGTPMENRVEEFRTLVGYLKPQLAASIDPRCGLFGSDAFRRAVAPVYLRRNQDDVLSELPERLELEDWVDLTAQDVAQYRRAVASGNFMAMRRAAYGAGSPDRSAKLLRLAEILGESADSGWKVVVFSYFHDVLDVAMKASKLRSFGPLTGKIAPANRQRLIDEFSNHDGSAVLFSQIEAGGTGLNIQAASVVVLTEPQWKPTIEEQAIARCHRMGQVRRVHVHRLLATDSVDARMVEIVNRKRQLFDDYARRSDLRDASPDAVDVSNVELARSEAKIIQSERERLGLADAVR